MTPGSGTRFNNAHERRLVGLVHLARATRGAGRVVRRAQVVLTKTAGD